MDVAWPGVTFIQVSYNAVFVHVSITEWETNTILSSYIQNRDSRVSGNYVWSSFCICVYFALCEALISWTCQPEGALWIKFGFILNAEAAWHSQRATQSLTTAHYFGFYFKNRTGSLASKSLFWSFAWLNFPLIESTRHPLDHMFFSLHKVIRGEPVCSKCFPL